MNQSLLSSDRQDWRTPREVLNLVREFGPIGLDPCSGHGSIVDAREAWDAEADGLSRPWTHHGMAFVNPPFGRELPTWAAKIAAEAVKGVEIVALVPARTDTAWWQDHMARAQAICWWRGRIRFFLPEDGQDKPGRNGAAFPSVLVYFGPRAEAFRQVFGRRGLVTVAASESLPCQSCRSAEELAEARRWARRFIANVRARKADQVGRAR